MNQRSNSRMVTQTGMHELNKSQDNGHIFGKTNLLSKSIDQGDFDERQKASHSLIARSKLNNSSVFLKHNKRNSTNVTLDETANLANISQIPQLSYSR